MTCTGQPISWLALEQFALGEAGGRAAEVERHLASCPACRACLDSIQRGPAALPPLDEVTLAAARRRARQRRLVRGAGLAAVAAVAAALLLVVGPDRQRGELGGVKGDAAVLSLVRERAGTITHDPASYRAGDRFKLLVTCAEPGEVTARIEVRQGAEVFAPLPAAALRCGNRVPLPGALSLTGGGPAAICVSLDGGPARCVELEAEGEHRP